MCGIVGIIEYKNYSSKNILQKMTDTLISRGPDDSGYTLLKHQKYQVGFGHRRLSILDLSLYGHQPMQFKNLTIIYNGEVYNFQEVQKELIEQGYIFNSHSDTEVILKAFDRWGVDCIHKFRGMFAFSIYDSEKNKVYIIRDRVGVKPLYYYQNNDIFLFSSELKSFYQHPKFEKIINKDALSLYLQFGYIQAPHSIFKNTYKLLPGHFIEYDLKNKKLEIQKYWDVSNFYQEDKYSMSELEATDKLEEILTDSFKLRMISDVPVGIFLSGGVDSSLVTAILQKYSDLPINTFTIGFDENRYNEAPYAKKIAEYLGTNHTEHYCSKQDAMDIIAKLSTIYDEPFGDSSAIPTTLVSEIAKKHVSVVLSGDGGDELFCGYTSYGLFEKRFETINALPAKKALKHILSFFPDPIVKLQDLHEKYYLKYLKFKNTLEHKDISNMYKVSNSVFTKHEVEKLLSNHYFFQKDNENILLDPLEKMMISDFKGYLADDILVKVDRASMSISLESREPLLDQNIIEFAAKLPIEYKQNKIILKRILSKYVPNELFERKKTGFGIPINDWLRNELKYLIDEYLDDKIIEEIGIFDVQYIQSLKSLFLQGKNDDRKIWTILMFQMWYINNIGES